MTDAALDGGLPSSGGPLPLSQLCAAVTADICAFGMQCARWEYRDVAHCVAAVACTGVMDLSASVASGAVTYDPVEAGRCQARFQSDPCNFGSFLVIPNVFQILSRCPGTLTPRRGAGDACVVTEECTAALYCKKQTLGALPICPGQCTPVPKAGESCTNAPCAPGLYCSAQVCRPYAHVQDACASDGECFADPAVGTTRLWCDLASHTCRPPAAEGELCGIKTPGGDASMQIFCAPGLWCDALFVNRTGACRKPGGAGSPCSNNFDACAPGLHCVGYSADMTLGTCAAPVTSGGECVMDADCTADLRCINGVCSTPSPVAGACESTSDCQQGLTCPYDDFKCRQPRYPGDACGDPDAACVQSICRDGHCVDFAAIGQPCVTGSDCQLGLGCPRGVCRDSSICIEM